MIRPHLTHGGSCPSGTSVRPLVGECPQWPGGRLVCVRRLSFTARDADFSLRSPWSKARGTRRQPNTSFDLNRRAARSDDNAVRVIVGLVRAFPILTGTICSLDSQSQ